MEPRPQNKIQWLSSACPIASSHVCRLPRGSVGQTFSPNLPLRIEWMNEWMNEVKILQCMTLVEFNHWTMNNFGFRHSNEWMTFGLHDFFFSVFHSQEWIYVCMYVWFFMTLSLYIFSMMNEWMYVCMFGFSWLWVCTFLAWWMNECMYVCMYVCMVFHDFGFVHF
jgi:hypothetical protein